MFTEFTNQLQKNQTMMIENWNNPMRYTMKSFFQFAEVANDAVNKLTNQHTAALNSFFPQGPKPNKSGMVAIKSAVTTEFGTGHVAVVTGGIGGIGTDICRSLARHGNKVIATYISFEA